MWAALLLFVALPAAAADGAALFGQHCAACHQADASGTVGLAPPLKGEHWRRLSADRSYLASVLVHGLSGPIKIGADNFIGSMPGFGAQLDDATLAAIATHLRQLQGAVDDKPYAADEFRQVRGKPGSPPQTRLQRVQALGK